MRDTGTIKNVNNFVKVATGTMFGLDVVNVVIVTVMSITLVTTCNGNMIG